MVEGHAVVCKIDLNTGNKVRNRKAGLLLFIGAGESEVNHTKTRRKKRYTSGGEKNQKERYGPD